MLHAAKTVYRYARFLAGVAVLVVAALVWGWIVRDEGGFDAQD